LAQENDCRIIQSPYDTYTIARLMNQSIPIRYFMCKENLLTFTQDDFIDDVRVVMADKRHRYFPIVTPSGKYEGMISRRNLLSMQKRRVILVDHNEKSQAVSGLEDAEILEIIDHHKIGNIETIEPVYFRNQPLGCTATIIYQMYHEHDIEIPKQMAGLLCSAILSDTLAFRSPTCTAVDKKAAQDLAQIAGIQNIDKYACEMFAAGSDLADKSATEIFYQDFKKFTAQDTTFGVGQISSMSTAELEDVKQKLVPELEKFASEQKAEMIFFMLTNIMQESSQLLLYGKDAEEMIQSAFGVNIVDGSVNLEGVVSRKKQLIPKLMKAVSAK
jgi:manganese-dependent inorganic pyrophosphatase